MDKTYDIKLAPSGILIWSGGDSDLDWRERLFRLGAGPEPGSADPAARFWYSLARSFILHFLKAAADFWSVDEFEGRAVASGHFQLPPPPEGLWPGFLTAAPPLDGGEYLETSLPLIWNELGRWLEDDLEQAVQVARGPMARRRRRASPTAFLAKYAPLWLKVGRVYFHLAENAGDPAKTFTFTATYTTGLNPDGQPQHIPLSLALELPGDTAVKPDRQRIMAPLGRAAKNLTWVAQLVDSKRILQPICFSPAEVFSLLKDVPQLDEAGLMVNIPDCLQRRPCVILKIVLEAEEGETRIDDDSLLTFSSHLVLGDESLTEAELKEILAIGSGLVYYKGRWVEVDKDRLDKAMVRWQHIKKRFRDGKIPYHEGKRLLAGDFRSDGELAADSLFRFEVAKGMAGLLEDTSETQAH